MSGKATLVALVVAAFFFSYDLIDDMLSGDPVAEYGLELFIFASVLIALGSEILQTVKLRKELAQSETQLSAFKGQLAKVMQDQFEAWGLSASEQDVAWLIVKGYSFREISELREVSEKTVRKQAGAVYAKSGTSNRSEFTASFLEDMLSEPA